VPSSRQANSSATGASTSTVSWNMCPVTQRRPPSTISTQCLVLDVNSAATSSMTGAVTINQARLRAGPRQLWRWPSTAPLAQATRASAAAKGTISTSSRATSRPSSAGVMKASSASV
jgi:hypothetical protein